MNYGAFIKQLNKAKDIAPGHNAQTADNNRTLKHPVSPHKPEKKKDEENMKAQNTQDFKLILAQMEKRGAILEDDAASKQLEDEENFNKYSPKLNNDSKNQLKAKNQSKGNSIASSAGLKLGQNPDQQLSKDILPAKVSEPPRLRLTPLIPMSLNRDGVKQVIDENTKNEIAEKVYKMLLSNLDQKGAAEFTRSLRPRSLEEEDQEEIERMLENDHPQTNYGFGSSNQSAYNRDFRQKIPHQPSHFNAPEPYINPDGSIPFFSGFGMKPITLSEDAIKAAKARLGEMGLEDEVDDFDNATMKGASAFSNPFVTLSASNQQGNNFSGPFFHQIPNAVQKVQKNTNADHFSNTDFNGGGFNQRSFAVDDSGPISFTTGCGKAPKNIDPEAIKKAMALLALSDDEDAENEVLPPNTFDENARLGLHNTKKNTISSKDPGSPLTVKSVAGGEIIHHEKTDNSKKSMGNNSDLGDESPKRDLNEEYSLKAVIERGRQEQNSKATDPGKDKKGSKNPFGAEGKKGGKKVFEVPHLSNTGLTPRVNFPIMKPNTIKVKTSLSSFHGKVTIDNERYNSLTQNLNKRRKLVGYKEKLVTRNYGHNFLTSHELYNYLEPELREYDIKGVEVFAKHLLIEMRYQLPKMEIDQGWVEHHLTMLTRKYYNRVKNEGASSSSSVSRTTAVLPYKVNLTNLITDLYYRGRKEEFFGRFSVLRLLFEGQLPPDRRICLMVSTITKSRDKWTIEFTDGWYVIFTELYTNEAKEEALKTTDDYHNEFNNNLILRLILKDMLKEGDKIEVSHLTIQREENQPIYSKVRLESISYNALKKLPWNTQMGQLYTKLKPTKLRSIKPSGGLVPMVDVLILEKRGIKLSNTERDQFMIKAQSEECDRLAISFSVTVVDSLHLDPNYKHQPELYMVTFKSVDPGKYVDLCVGQRLQIYGVKFKKSKIHPVIQANFESQYSMGLHLIEARRNSTLPFDVSHASKTQLYQDLLGTRKKGFYGLEEMKDSLLKIINLTRSKCDDFMMTVALKYVKHTGNLCLFHLYEKHFIQIEIRSEESVKKAQKKDDNKGIPAQVNFWERVMKDLTHISETNVELLLFYDLFYTRQTKVLDFKSRGKIYIHKFIFDVINDYMLGENFILSNIESNCIERFLISEYKKAKNMKLGENDSISQLLSDMSKYPLA